MNSPDMSFTPPLSKLVGIALIVLAVTGPLAYCTVQQQNSTDSVKKACIEAKGEWSATWGGYCAHPKS